MLRSARRAERPAVFSSDVPDRSGQHFFNGGVGLALHLSHMGFGQLTPAPIQTP